MAARTMLRHSLSLAVVLLLSSCDSCRCGGVPSSLRAVEAAPFARCARVHADERSWHAAGLDMEVDDDTLTVAGARSGRARIAVTAGPWPTRGALAGTQVARLAGALKSQVATVVVVLGGIGNDADDALPWLRGLARSDALVVVVPGLTERWDAVTDALDALSDERVVDGTGLRRLVVGRAEVLLLAGSEGGRYGAPDGCGFDDDDLRALGALSPIAGSVRLLASVVAPRGVGPGASGIGVAGAPAGSARLAAWIRSARVQHVLSVWPAENAGTLRAGPRIEVVVPPAAGLPRVRHDGARVAPGAVLVTVGSTDVRAELVQP